MKILIGCCNIADEFLESSKLESTTYTQGHHTTLVKKRNIYL